jgi:hypothetical protein
MKRRRLVLVAVVLVLLAGWLALHQAAGLSEEEQRLLGTWYRQVPPNSFWPSGAVYVHDYGPDRTCRIHAIDGRTGTDHLGPNGQPSGIHGRWRVEHGRLIVDWDEGRLVRLRRMLPASFPGAIPYTPDACSIEHVSGNVLIVRPPNSSAGYLTRAPPD